MKKYLVIFEQYGDTIQSDVLAVECRGGETEAWLRMSRNITAREWNINGEHVSVWE